MLVALLSLTASWAAPVLADEHVEVVLPQSDQADRGGGFVAVNRRRVGLKGEIVTALCDSDAIIPRTAGRDLVIQFVGDFAGPTECKLITTQQPPLVTLLQVREMNADEQSRWEAVVSATSTAQ